jgi:hypothetical protein
MQIADGPLSRPQICAEICLQETDMSRGVLLVTVPIIALWVAPAWAQNDAVGKTVATFEGSGANAWTGNIRASDAEVVSLFEEGVKRSPTFKSLVDRLSKSDVIVYVRPDVTAKNNAPTKLTFLAAKGGYRYLVIRVASGRSKEQQLAMLGEKLQHVVVIADAASVVDSQSLKREFERVGKLSQPNVGDDFFFESPIAEDVKRRVLAEVSAKAAATK